MGMTGTGCNHERASVEDTDYAYTAWGRTIGMREYIVCPDCHAEGWFDVQRR